MTTTDVEATYTVAEVAAWLRCGRKKVADVARANGIGMQLGGRAGWRFTAADRLAIKRALTPAARKTATKATTKSRAGKQRTGRRHS